MRPVPERLSWRERAACRGVDVRLWFSYEKGRARAVCAACPVRAPCLAEALAREAPAPYLAAGVFGGLAADEREVLLRATERRPAV